jgi:hypothetical protein
VKAASTTKAMMSGRSLTNEEAPWPTPMTSSTDWMPTSCRAMYGMRARMPVKATASPRPELPKRPMTKSAGVTYPCRLATDHMRGMSTNTIGHTKMV